VSFHPRTVAEYHDLMSLRAVVRLFVLFMLVLLPREAAAQWYLVGYIGGNTTKAADVVIDRSAASTTLTFHDVEFEARPLSAPPYYGYRAGRLFGADRQWGLELEFIHLKVISLTALPYRVTGRANNVTIDTVVPMNTLVERYAMTHGLNFILINVVSRTPVGDGRVTLVARAGAGPTLPHAETRIGGDVLEQYEYGGMGGHGAVGLDIRLGRRFSVVAEYKLTVAKPRIDVSAGTGRMTALSHHVGMGLAFGLTR
jgi:hypothetical protein